MLSGMAVRGWDCKEVYSQYQIANSILFFKAQQNQWPQKGHYNTLSLL
jgi:hypothetical protein